MAVCRMAFMMATCVLAQDIPAGMRMELIESEDDSRDQYTIFKFKEKNGNETYYMGVGNKIELLGLVRDDITDMSIQLGTDPNCTIFMYHCLLKR